MISSLISYLISFGDSGFGAGGGGLGGGGPLPPIGVFGDSFGFTVSSGFLSFDEGGLGLTKFAGAGGAEGGALGGALAGGEILGATTSSTFFSVCSITTSFFETGVASFGLTGVASLI